MFTNICLDHLQIQQNLVTFDPNHLIALISVLPTYILPKFKFIGGKFTICVQHVAQLALTMNLFIRTTD